MKPSAHPKSGNSSEALTQQAALEEFVRLQQSQAEYLKWLEETEKKSDMDSYAYKKIR